MEITNDTAGGVDQTSQGVDQTSTTPAEPTAIDINDDALIRIKGSDKPVKFGEHVRGFQSQFTRASQEAARLKRELEQERQTRQRYEQERQRSQQGNSNGEPSIEEQLGQLPYLSGTDAARVVKSIQGQIQQRDQVLLGTLKKLQHMEGILNTLNQSHSTSSFDAKISKWLTDGGYPSGLANWAKEIYLAYEGDDLDTEFPQILKTRYDEIAREFEAQRQAKIRGARPQPFVPGRGGQATPSKPLEVKANTSPRELADLLYNQFAGSET